MATYKTIEEAARAYAAPRHIRGGKGGWLRQYLPGGPANGRSIYQHGWLDYGRWLIERGAIDPQDLSGNSVRRIKVKYGMEIRPERTWSRDAQQYALTGTEA